jgi:hypothetical protein
VNLRFLLSIVLCAVTSSFSQSTATSVYSESFRKGPTRVVAEHFDVKLTPQDSSYRERIKDSSGTDRYLLSVTPQGPEGDTEITSWQVRLSDLHHVYYDNILRASLEPSTDPKDSLWWLDPSKFARVPATAKRIIKVDNFYVVLQIKSLHYTPVDSPYLDSMTVAVEFTNSDPRVPQSTER